jgi:dihydroxy-acid dehydratase
MSGTAYGSIVLHVTPDAASGGPLAQVRDGDRIRLSVAQRRLDLLVVEEELAHRPVAPPSVPERGYAALYRREILQANRGCDFNFLRKNPLAGERL